MNKKTIKEITKAVLAVIAVGACISTIWFEPNEVAGKVIYIVAGIAIGYYFPDVNRKNLISSIKK